MGEKISTIILKVDLDCRSCYKKISKTVCKLQERENFQTIAFDEKNNTVTISGPFDPEKICKKLCCKAGKVIKDIQIKEKPKDKPKDEPKKDEPKKDKPKDDKPKDEPKKDKPKDDKPKDEPKKDKPKDEPKKDKPKEDDKPKDEPKKDKPKDEPKKDKPKDEPKTLKPNPPASEPVKTEPVYVVPEPQPGYQPGWQPGSGCACGCGSGYGGYYGDNRCCWCGRGPGWAPEGPPTVVYGAPAYKTCTFFCEEDPQSTCSVM